MGELEMKVEVLKLAVQMAEQLGTGGKLAELEPEITRLSRLNDQRSAVPAHLIPCAPLAPVKAIAEGLWEIIKKLPPL